MPAEIEYSSPIQLLLLIPSSDSNNSITTATVEKVNAKLRIISTTPPCFFDHPTIRWVYVIKATLVCCPPRHCVTEHNMPARKTPVFSTASYHWPMCLIKVDFFIGTLI